MFPRSEARLMRLALVADVSMAEVIGGAERVLCEQARGLSRRGHQVHVLTRRRPEHRHLVEPIDAVTEWRYPFDSGSLPAAAMSVATEGRRLWQRVAKEQRIQAAICHQPFSALCVHTTPRVCPSLYVCHSLSFEEFQLRCPKPFSRLQALFYQAKVRMHRTVEKAVLKRSHHIVVLSDYTRDKLHRAHGLNTRDISVVPGGVDLDRFRPVRDKAAMRQRLGLPTNAIVLLTVRNLVARMGLENLISAMTLVHRQEPRALLVIGGQGPLRDDLINAVSAGGLEKQVRFEGFVPEDRLPSYYQAADFFVLPTLDLEGFGLVTLEAMACGCPVLGTPVGGTVEILGRFDQDFLFKDTLPQAMAERILEKCRIINNMPEQWRHIVLACRRFVETHYCWDRHIYALEKLLEKCLNNKTFSLRSSA